MFRIFYTRRQFSVKSACTVPFTAIRNRIVPFTAVPDCTGIAAYEKHETVSTKFQFSSKTVVRTYLFRFVRSHRTVPAHEENRKVNSFSPLLIIPRFNREKENRNRKKKCIHFFFFFTNIKTYTETYIKTHFLTYMFCVGCSTSSTQKKRQVCMQQCMQELGLERV